MRNAPADPAGARPARENRLRSRRSCSIAGCSATAKWSCSSPAGWPRACSRTASRRSARLARRRGRLPDPLRKNGSAKTRIRFVTEGILLRQMLHDPELRGVGAILFDEFHERHLLRRHHAGARASVAGRQRVPISSSWSCPRRSNPASSKNISRPAPSSLRAGARIRSRSNTSTKPVRAENYPIWDLAADELARLAPQTEGDVLIFMPGKYEITRTIAAIRASRVSEQFVALPLYSELPPHEQDAALAPSREAQGRSSRPMSRKLPSPSTACGLVIDSGLARIARFDPRRGINTLFIEKISRASADQRAGRAGRTAPGHCLRLWTEREHIERAPQELPEVKRLDLAEVVLTLKASGIEDSRGLSLARTARSESARKRGATARPTSGALAAAVTITSLGRRMLAFPVASALRADAARGGRRQRCVRGIALIAALTQGRNSCAARKANRCATTAKIFSASEDRVRSLHSPARFSLRGKQPLRSPALRSLGSRMPARRAKRVSSGSNFSPSREPRGLDIAEGRAGAGRDRPLRARWVSRSGRGPARRRNAALRARPQSPRRARARKRGASRPAAHRLGNSRDRIERRRAAGAAYPRDRDQGGMAARIFPRSDSGKKPRSDFRSSAAPRGRAHARRFSTISCWRRRKRSECRRRTRRRFSPAK